MLVTHLLQVKAGGTAAEELCPRQKEAHAQAKGAQVDRLGPAQTDGLIFRRGGGGGFWFRFDGDVVGHMDFLWLLVNRGESSRDQMKRIRQVGEALRDDGILAVGGAEATQNLRDERNKKNPHFEGSVVNKRRTKTWLCLGCFFVIRVKFPDFALLLARFFHAF